MNQSKSRQGRQRQSSENAHALQQRPAPQPLQRQRPSYSVEEKIRAVTILVAYGGLTVEAMTLARQTLNSNISTTALARWLRRYGDEVRAVTQKDTVPADLPAIVQDQHESIVARLNGLVDKLLTHLETDSVINKAELRDASVSLGIYLDKVKSLRNISAEVEQRLIKIDLACQRRGYVLVDILDDVLIAIESRPQLPTTIDTKSLNSGED